jgi:hypothetical protein
VVLPLVFSAWAVVEPAGWVRDAELVATIAARSPQLASLDVSAFRAPGEPDSTFVVEHGRYSGAFALAFDELAERSQAAGWVRVAHDEVGKPGYQRQRVELERRDTGARLAVQLVTTADEGVLGVCRASRETIAVCRDKLDALDLTVASEDAFDRIRDILYGVAGLVIAALAAAIAVPRWRRRRELRRSARLVDGELVTITGTVRAAGAVIEAPLSGRACVFHRSRARLFARGAAGHLVAEPTEQDARPFLVDTPHGAVRVDEAELALELPPSLVVPRDTPGQRAFVARHSDAADPSTAFDEVVIAPGDKVTLRGVVRVEIDPVQAGERGYRDGAQTVARLVTAGTQPVAVLRTW